MKKSTMLYTPKHTSIPLSNHKMFANHMHIKILFGFFVASLFIRLSALWILPEPHLPSNAKIAYLGGAHLLIDGEGFRDPAYPVFTPPLYAILIAGSLYLFGDDQIPVKMAQALADSMTVVIVYTIVNHIFGHKTAFLTSAVLSIYPFSIYPVIYIGTETFFTLFLSIFVLLTIYAIKFGNVRYYLAAGFVLGLATLTRGTTQFYPLFFLLILIFLKKVEKPILLRYLAFCAAFALVIMPWSLRNYIVLGDFIPVATAGNVFVAGSSEKLFTISERSKEWPKYLEVLKSRGIQEPPKWGKPSDADAFLLRAGLENYKMRLQNEPLSIIPFVLNKFLRLWYATETGRNHGIILAINMLIYPFALAGLILVWLQRKDLAVLPFGLVLYFVMLHCFSFPLFRYMVPVMPYVISLGSFAVVGWAKDLRHRSANLSPELLMDEGGSGGGKG